MRNWIVLFFLIPTLLGGCTKFGKNITVKGYVLNPVTGKGIEGIEVWLQKSSGTFPGGYKNVKETVTDANGYYEINAAALQDRYLRASTSLEYYDIGWDSDASASGSGQLYVETGKTTWANFLTVPYSHSKLILNNANCQGPGDTMVLYQANQINTFDGTEPWEHVGCVYWETNGYSEIPMGNVYYRWEVTRSGTTDVYFDTVFYGEGEYKTYTINY